MGLDTYAAHTPDDIELTEEDIQAFKDANISLCGGIFSGGGNDGSFRGKVYSELIYEITGESLYAEWLPQETVKKMYESLLACDPEEAAGWAFRNTPQEVQELRKFFKVCVERGLGLVGWW
jgi:hypothetical protein